MTRRLRTPIAAALLLVAASAQAQPDPAQEQEVRARPILNTGGPAGVVRAMAFSGDSQRLVAAGVDKATYVWDVGGPGGPDRVTSIATLRWEIARGNNGSVNTVAVNPRHGEISVAGTSARGFTGDIALFDAGERLLKTSLPRDRDPVGLPGHRADVTQVDFAPDGDKLISVATDGEVLLWRPRDARRLDWTSTTVRPARGAKALSRRVRFLDANIVVVGELVDAQRDTWRVVLYSTAGTPRALGALPTLHQGGVIDVAVAPDSPRWASCDATGAVYLWNGAGGQEPVMLRRDGPPVRRLAFAPGGLLAVGTDVVVVGAGRRPSQLELWDTEAGRLIDQAPLSAADHCHALAVSPDGRVLATQNVTTNQMLLFTLRDEAGRPVARPLSRGEPIAFSSVGRPVRTVAFGDRYRVAFGDGRPGTVNTAFDPETGAFVAAEPVGQWRLADAAGAGWRVEPATESADRSVVRLTGAGRAYAIRLNPRLQGTHFSETLIPGPDGRPAAVAIGTDIAAGVFVYSLPAGPQDQPRLLRYYRDHSDTVTSLAVSADGRYLASGSIDQTIKYWPLAGLFNPPRGFENRSAWGATFQPAAGGVVASDVDVRGIAHGRGIRDGDLITSVTTEREDKQVVRAERPADMLRLLNDEPLYQLFLLGAQRDGRELKLPLIMPAWEPALTLFVARTGEWAAWHPSGYYDVSLADGGDLFGWQVNRGRSVPPKVVKAAFLQKELERPDVIRRLLGAGSLEAALAQAPDRRPATSVARQAARSPEVQILTPRTGAKLKDRISDDLIARIKLPPGMTADRFDVRASVGGRNLGDPERVERDGDALRYVWRTPSFDRLNRFEVLATERDKAALDALFGSDVAFARGDQAGREAKYRLHFFAIACEKYPGANRGGFRQLKHTIDDVDAIYEILKQKSRSLSFFELAPEPTVLRDNEVTKPALKKAIARVKRQMDPNGPQDVVLVYLQGHGVAVDRQYYFVPTNKVLPTSIARNPAAARRDMIPWEVFAEIRDQRCLVVWLLNTCQSGVAAQTVDGRIDRERNIKAPIREALRGSSMVISTVNDDADTHEGDVYVNYGSRPGGTPFADAALRGFDGEADGYLRVTRQLGDRFKTEIVDDAETDGVVSLAELAYYITRTVSEDTGGENTPRVAPQGLLDAAASTRLVRVRQ